MDKRKVSIVVGLGILMIGLLVGIGYYALNMEKGTVFGKGEKVEVDGILSGINGFEVSVDTIGYFEQGVEEVLGEFSGYSEDMGYVLVGLEMVNESDSKQEWNGLDVMRDGNRLGTSLAVYKDASLSYAVDKEVIENYDLMVTGEEFLPGEKRMGYVYIPVNGEWEEGNVELKMVDNEIGKVIEKTGNVWGEEEYSTFLEKKEDFEKDLEKEVVEDEIGKGMKSDSKGIQWGEEGEVIVRGESIYVYEEAKEGFREGTSHLVSYNGTEKVWAMDVTIKNEGEGTEEVKDFYLDIGDRVLESVTTVVGKGLEGNYIGEDVRERYGFLDYRGRGDTSELESGEEIEGKIIFVSSDIEGMGVGTIQYGEGNEIEVEVK